MSDKPDDIPQDIWEAAQAAFERQLNEWSTSEAVARAIMAERERAIAACERQKASFASDEYATPQPLGGLMQRFACDQCIEAIRKEGK